MHTKTLSFYLSVQIFVRREKTKAGETEEVCGQKGENYVDRPENFLRQKQSELRVQLPLLAFVVVQTGRNIYNPAELHSLRRIAQLYPPSAVK